MTYASGGLIQYQDYNGFIGSLDTGSGASLNQIWGTGFADCGYGQTGSLLSTVTAGTSVTAAQWAGAINRLNTIRTHQSGSGSGLSAPTAGSTISYLSTLSSAISTAYTNRTATNYASPSTTSLTKGLTLIQSAGFPASTNMSWTVQWSSVNAARYFFNAGGYYIVSYASFTNGGGTARGTSIQTVAQTNFASKRVNIHSMGARTGTGGIVTQDTTNVGYYELANGNTNYCIITGQSYPYVGDYVYMQGYTNAVATNGGNGNTHYVTFGAYSSATGSSGANDSINITLYMTLQVYYPEVTNLTSSWGTVTIT
jgi:hypothetical protein